MPTLLGRFRNHDARPIERQVPKPGQLARHVEASRSHSGQLGERTEHASALKKSSELFGSLCDTGLLDIVPAAPAPEAVGLKVDAEKRAEPAMEVLAVANTYDDLVQACVSRRRELGLSQMAVDEISGLQAGYIGQLECGSKRLGALSLPCLLQALGLELQVVRLVPHHERQRRLSPDVARTMGRRGARAPTERGLKNSLD